METPVVELGPILEFQTGAHTPHQKEDSGFEHQLIKKYWPMAEVCHFSQQHSTRTGTIK